MKSSALLIAFLGIVSPLIAQISLTQADFISSGGMEFYSNSTSAVDYTSTGANYTWDFSNLSITNQDTTSFYNITSAPILVQASYGFFASSEYQADYYTPNQDFALADIPANLIPITIDRVDEFIKVENNQITKVGYSVNVQGQGLPFNSDTIERLYKLPLNYGDIDSSRAYTSFDLNPLYDAQLRQYIQHNYIVDGYGSVTTPYGTFNSLRIHHQIEELDSIYIALSGGVGTWYALPLPKKHIYEWWTNNENTPILKIETTESFGIQTVSKTQFKDDIGLGTANEQLLSNLKVYPNPAQSMLQFSQEVDEVILINSLGRMVLNRSKITVMDVSELPQGVYTLTIKLDGKTKLNRVVIQ